MSNNLGAQRPAALTVMAIIGIIWGSLLLLMSLWGFAAHFITTPGPGGAALEELKREALYLVAIFGLGSLQMLLHVLLIIGCIGAWKLRPAARTALFAYAAAYTLLALVQMAIQYGYVMPRMMDAMLTAAPAGGGAPPAAFATIMKISMVVGACIGAVIALAMPTYVVIVLTRKKVRDAFNGIFPAAGAFDPLPHMPPQVQ